MHTTLDIDLHNFQPLAINLHDSLSLTPATIQTYSTVACGGFHCWHVNKSMLTQAKERTDAWQAMVGRGRPNIISSEWNIFVVLPGLRHVEDKKVWNYNFPISFHDTE